MVDISQLIASAKAKVGKVAQKFDRDQSMPGFQFAQGGLGNQLQQRGIIGFGTPSLGYQVKPAQQFVSSALKPAVDAFSTFGRTSFDSLINQPIRNRQLQTDTQKAIDASNRALQTAKAAREAGRPDLSAQYTRSMINPLQAQSQRAQDQINLSQQNQKELVGSGVRTALYASAIANPLASLSAGTLSTGLGAAFAGQTSPEQLGTSFGEGFKYGGMPNPVVKGGLLSKSAVGGIVNLAEDALYAKTVENRKLTPKEIALSLALPAAFETMGSLKKAIKVKPKVNVTTTPEGLTYNKKGQLFDPISGQFAKSTEEARIAVQHVKDFIAAGGKPVRTQTRLIETAPNKWVDEQDLQTFDSTIDTPKLSVEPTMPKSIQEIKADMDIGVDVGLKKFTKYNNWVKKNQTTEMSLPPQKTQQGKTTLQISPEERLLQSQVSPQLENQVVPPASPSLEPIIRPGTRTRGLTESVQQAPNISGEVKAGVKGTYTQKPNSKLMGEAQALLQDGAVIDFKNTKNLDQKVAATIQEALNAQKAGNHEAAANLFNNLSEHGTELGRSVQAFSLLKNMSPESIALSAAGKIKKYNTTHSTKIPELSGEQVKMIADKVQAMDLLKGREKNIALNELNDTIGSFIPSSLGDKAIAVWKAGLLTSFRTHERNFVGNSIHGILEAAKDLPATATDIALSKKTGTRTVTPTLKGIGEFGSKSTKQQMTDIFQKGYDPSQTIDKFDYKKVTWADTPVQQALKKYTDVVFRSLGASDKPFYNAAMARSLYDQAGAEAINAGRKGDASFIENLVSNPTEQMTKNAINDANVATFKTKNAASSISSAIKRELGKNEATKILGEVTLPFTGVPSSILGQTVAYSPIGLVKGIAKAVSVTAETLPEIQRMAAQEVGRGVMGTGVYALGAYLASQGLITGQPKDATESRQWELENKPRNSIMLGGKWRSLNSIGPESIVFLAGAKLNEEMNNPEGSAGSYVGGLGKDLLDQSFVQGINAPVNAITDPQRYGKSYAGQLVSSPIPNILKDTAKAFDPTARELNTIPDYVKAGIPGVRNTMVEKRDALGNVIPQEPTGVNAYVDLFNSKTPRTSAVIDELSRLNKVGNNATPGKISASQTIGGQKVKLTPQELNKFEDQVGVQGQAMLENLVTSPGYKSLSDEDKSKAIDNVMTKVRKQTRVNPDLLKGGTPTGSIDSTSGVYFNMDGNQVDVGKVASMPSTTGYDKVKKEEATFKIIDDVMKLPVDQQEDALKKLGVTQDDAQYYSVAKSSVEAKTAYVMDGLEKMINQGATRDQALSALLKMRNEVNGQQIASDNVLKELYDQNIISKQDYNNLKQVKVSGGQIKRKVVGRAKKAKAPEYNFKALMKPTKVARRGKVKIKRIKI